MSNLMFQPKYGGPSIILRDDGYIDVDGLGIIRRTWNKNIDQWRDLIRQAALHRDIPESWIAGVMIQESGGSQKALSPVGAVGLMQVMPSTPMQMFKDPISKQDLWKPENNIDMGARVLAAHAKKASWNPVHVAAMYNAGGVYPYSGSIQSCTHDGLWHLRENCGYTEQVIRGINAAIDAGYSGTGVTEVSSSSGLLKVLAGVALVLVPFGLLIYTGRVPPPAFARGLVAKHNPYQPTWRDYIRGEWWLLPDGETIFADQDTGDVPGHAALAQDYMLEESVLIEGLVREGKISEGASIYFESASQVLAEHEHDISDELGAASARHPPIRRKVAFGGIPLWRSIKDDPEGTFMECWGAIRVAGRSFQLHHLTDQSIEVMQNFLLDQFAEGGKDVQPDKSKIEIEDMRGNYTEIPIEEFLVLKHTREIFP